MSPWQTNHWRRQQGVSMVVVLILLLVITLLGLAVLRGTLMGERMSAIDYSLDAFRPSHVADLFYRQNLSGQVDLMRNQN